MSDRTDPGRARRRAWRATLWCTTFTWGAPTIAIGVAVAASVITFLFVSAPAGYVTALALGTLVVRPALGIVGKRESARLPIGLDLERERHHELWRLVCEAARVSAVDAPPRVRLTAESVVRIVRHRRRLTIAIGLPWLASTRDELEAALVHALAEASAAGESSRVLRCEARCARSRDLAGATRVGRMWLPYTSLAHSLLRRAAERRTEAAEQACAAVLEHSANDVRARATERNEAFARYWLGDVAPCLEEGFRPPILGGWRTLLAASRQEPDAPSLVPSDEDLERRLLAALSPDATPTLVDVAWARVGAAVWLPRIRREVRVVASALGRFSIGGLAEAIRDDRDHGALAYAAALTLALVDDRGWTLVCEPGRPLEIRNDAGSSLFPFELCLSILDLDFDQRGWLEFVGETGIADLEVDAAAAGATSAEGDERQRRLAVPPTASRLLMLSRPPHRRRAYAILGIGVTLGVPSGLTLMLAATRAQTIAGKAFVIGLGLATLACLAWWVTSRLRVLRPTGTVVVTGETATISHPGLLKEPFCVPREAVRAVIVDAGEWADDRRFLLGSVEHAAAAGEWGLDDSRWLWRQDAPTIVPLLGQGNEIPNVAILLDDPALSPRVRTQRSSGPLSGESLTGLLLAVDDATAARTAFEPWGLTRVGTVEDASHVYLGFHGIALRATEEVTT